MAPPVLSSVMFQETFWSSLSAFLLCGSVHFSKLAMPHVATLTNTYTPEFAYLVDSTNTLLLTLFVLLVLLALPPFAGRAHYNPCVTIFNLFGGACTIDQAILRLFGQAAGATVAVYGLGKFIALFPKELEGVPLAAPKIATGVDFQTAVMVEAGVAATVIFANGLIDMMGLLPTPLKQVAGAAVYIGVLVAEQGKYTGSIMNPLTVMALIAHELGGYAPLALDELRIAEHLAPYALGAFAGSAALGVVMRILGLVPGQSARRNVQSARGGKQKMN